MVDSLKAKDMNADLKALNLGSIVSCKDTDWYSPGSVNCYKSLAQKLVARTLYEEKALDSCQNSWFAGLATNRMIIRKKGTWGWVLVVGVIYDVLVKVWKIEYSQGVGSPGFPWLSLLLVLAALLLQQQLQQQQQH